MRGDGKLGVYVSVPFCRAKCSFCNFASGVSTASTIDRYVARLCGEIGAAREAAERSGAELPGGVDTVYFGGGTPSLLTPRQLGDIFAALRREFAVDSDAEITLEAAPGQIAEDVLEAAIQLGVNRLSLGVQSFVDRESMAVGRSHTGESCVREVERLREAGLAEVGADLIAGLPYQTAESWERSLEAAGRLAASGALTHLSVYMLEIDEDSRLGREVLGGGLRIHAPAVGSEDVAAELYERACQWLPEHGFAQYEISNFANRGHRSRHNLKYWKREPYMGFGLDAHSMLRCGNMAVRFANTADLAAYEAFEQGGEMLPVEKREAFEEAVFLGLRLSEGVCPGCLRDEFGSESVAACSAAVAELTAEGLMQVDGGRWRLTLRGRLVSNSVFGRLLESV